MSCPAVPPSVPICNIPQSVTTGKGGRMSCSDEDGSPSPTYRWYKDGTLLPTDPSRNAAFKNATYKLNAESGILVSSPHCYALCAILQILFFFLFVLCITSKYITAGVFISCQDGHRRVLL